MITRLPDWSGFCVCDIDTSARPPRNPVFWNPGNKVVQDHRDGTIDLEQTNIERAKRGLPVPWSPDLAEAETRMLDIL